MNYKPYLIAPFGLGLDLDTSPWLLPKDAFTSIENGHIQHGRVEKRAGYESYGSMHYGMIILSATSANPAVFSVTSTAGLTNGDTVNLSMFTDASWSTLNNKAYTLSTITPTTFQLVSTGASPATISTAGYPVYTASSGRLGYSASNRIMGIENYYDSTGQTRYNIIWDTKRAAVFNATVNDYVPIELNTLPGADFMSGGEYNYIWTTNWEYTANTSILYFTNGKAQNGSLDGIFYYQPGSTLTNPVNNVYAFNPTVNNSGDTLKGAQMLFTVKKRLLALNTVEGSTRRPQRARFSKAGDPTKFNSSEPGQGVFTDASTGEEIVSARQIGDYIIVFFTDSVWMLSPNANASNPFSWKRLNSYRASGGRMASIDYDRYIISMGQRGIFASNPSDTSRIDNKIESFADDYINAQYFKKVFSKREYDYKRTWILYPGKDPDTNENNAALIIDEDSKAFSTYKIEMNCLGYGSQDKSLSASDFLDDQTAETFDDNTIAYSFTFTSDSELFLGGDISGNIFRMSRTNADNGEKINFSLSSAEWNPFTAEGVKAQLGYIDIYFQSNANTGVTVQFFTDKNQNYYTQQSAKLLPEMDFVSDINLIETLTPSTSGVKFYSPKHGLSNGDIVYSYHIQGTTELNNIPILVANVTENTFEYAVDASAFTAYSGNGMIFRRQFYPTKIWLRFFAGGIGNTHSINLISEGSIDPLVIHAFKPYFRPIGKRSI